MNKNNYITIYHINYIPWDYNPDNGVYRVDNYFTTSKSAQNKIDEVYLSRPSYKDAFGEIKIKEIFVHE